MKDEQLDFAQSYIASAMQLAYQFFNRAKPPFRTFKDYKKSYFLGAHFLMTHGIELYLKFFIASLGGTPSSKGHDLNKLISEVEKLSKEYYKRNIFNKQQKKFIGYINRNMEFRYPTDKHWKVKPEIFNEADNWTERKVNNFIKKCNDIRKKLNDWGYKIECNKKIK